MYWKNWAVLISCVNISDIGITVELPLLLSMVLVVLFPSGILKLPVVCVRLANDAIFSPIFQSSELLQCGSSLSVSPLLSLSRPSSQITSFIWVPSASNDARMFWKVVAITVGGPSSTTASYCSSASNLIHRIIVRR